MSWVIVRTAAADLAPGATSVTDMLATRSDFQVTDLTVTRVRGEIVVSPLSSSDVERAMFMGIIVVSQQAEAAGAGSVPDPSLDNADWLWFSGVNFVRSFYNDAGTDRAYIPARTIVIDSKAQRKMNEENKTLAFVVKNQGAGTLEFEMYARTLLKRS